MRVGGFLRLGSVFQPVRRGRCSEGSCGRSGEASRESVCSASSVSAGPWGRSAVRASRPRSRRPIGPVHLLLPRRALLEAAVPLDPPARTRRSRTSRPRQSPASAAKAAESPPAAGSGTGIRLVGSSPVPLGICLFLVFYSISSTLIYFEQARIVRPHSPIPRRGPRSSPGWNLYVKRGVRVDAGVLTSRVLSWLGVGGTLSWLPW